MNELDQRLAVYFNTTAYEERKKELEACQEDLTCAEVFPFLKDMFDRRYEFRSGQEVDNFLFVCVEFCGIERSGSLFKRSSVKTVQRLLHRLGTDRELTQVQETLLYREIRNVTKRYFETCQGAHYHRKYFGLAESNEKEKRNHMLSDIWSMTVGLGKKLSLEQELSLWSKAVIDEFLDTSRDAPAEWDAYLRFKGNID